MTTRVSRSFGLDLRRLTEFLRGHRPHQAATHQDDAALFRYNLLVTQDVPVVLIAVRVENRPPNDDEVPGLDAFEEIRKPRRHRFQFLKSARQCTLRIDLVVRESEAP